MLEKHVGNIEGSLQETRFCHLQLGETQVKTTQDTAFLPSLGQVGEGESNPPAAPLASRHHDSGPTML